MMSYVSEIKLVCVRLFDSPSSLQTWCEWRMFGCHMPGSAAQILEGMPMTMEVEKFLRAIGPFYELVEEKKKISQVSDLSAGWCLRVFACVVVESQRGP